MTGSVRGRQAPPVREARTGAFGRRNLTNVLIASVAVGLFLSFIGAYGTGRIPFGWRTAMMVGVSVIAGLGGVASLVMVRTWPFIGRHRWRQGLAAGLVMAAPMGVVVWSATNLVMLATGRPTFAASHLPAYIAVSVVTSIFFCGFAAAVAPQGAQATEPVSPAPSRFLDRLPPKLRGADVWAVEAEDHYLRLHTSKGQDLILMRLSDAIGELDGIEGAQTHRSWWVARDAVVGVERGDGRASLTLKDGTIAPVSRSQAKALRQAGWF